MWRDILFGETRSAVRNLVTMQRVVMWRNLLQPVHRLSAWRGAVARSRQVATATRQCHSQSAGASRDDAHSTPQRSSDLFTRAHAFGDAVAVKCPTHGSLTYSELLHRAGCMARVVLDAVYGPDADAVSLGGKPVAFLCQPGQDYVVTQWAIWWAGGTAVPLCTSHPLPELEYVIEDSQAVAAVTDAANSDTMMELILEELMDPVPFVTVSSPAPTDVVAQRAQVGGDDPAMIMYTSGETGSSCCARTPLPLPSPSVFVL